MNYFVRTQEIRRWAQERLDARSTLPHLLRRLVHATVENISKIDFPAYESIQRSGFDGVIECQLGNAWVPSGRSVWELSVSKDCKTKAAKDFQKRTDETPENERKKSTFVFVTPRHWEKKVEWSTTATASGKWKEVRAYDADDLEQWMEAAPAVGSWFSQAIGSRPPGIDDIERRWQAIIESTKRSLSPEVFLGSRERSREQLQQWIKDSPNCLVISTRSPTEAIDFVCAEIVNMVEDEKTEILARSIIVESETAWKTLRDSQGSLLLIVDPTVELTSEEISRAVSSGHHILLAMEPSRTNAGNVCELERPREHLTSQALENCGYSPIEAEQAARAAAGSLAILKRRLSRYPDSYRPQWLEGIDAKTACACLLLGGWNGNNDADCAAVEALGGKPYGEIEADCQRLAQVRDPLLIHAAGNWRVISKDEAWDVLNTQVSPAALKEFETIAIEILADDDPKYGIPLEEQYLAAVKGHIPRYSKTIKKHVAETLALLGAIGPSLEVSASFDIEGFLCRIVSELLTSESTWHRWASLGSKLSLLAEASPDVFLSAIKNDLTESDSQLEILLKNGGDTFFSGCNHSGLLWALETLAWSPKRLPDVCRALLTLDAKDPGGQWANRPKASLCEILSYWIPQTTATVEQRISVLNSLTKINEESAWKVHLSLLPIAGGVSTPTHRPYWRDWANSWDGRITYGEIHSFIDAVVKNAIELAGIAATRWQELIQHIGQLPVDLHSEMVIGLDALANSNIDEPERRLVSDELSEQLNLHRHHKDADWAISEAHLVAYDAILDRLQPRNPVLRHAWLFAQFPDRYYMREGSMEERDKAVDEDQRTALREILDNGGITSVIELSKVCNTPFIVGKLLGDTTEDQFIGDLIPSLFVAEDPSLNLVGGFVSSRFNAMGWSWADEALESCSSDDERSWLLAMLPFEPDTWQRAIRFGKVTSEAYWKRCRAFGQKLDVPAIEAAVKELVIAKRIGNAIDVIGMALHRKLVISSGTLIQPLESLLQLEADDFKNQFGTITAYEIGELFDTLQQSSDVDEDILMRLEWNYLKLLGDHRSGSAKTLFRRLSEQPNFFVELLTICFKSKDEPEEVQEPTKHQKATATQAYRLLHDWKVIPGTNDLGAIDETVLRKWCIESRRLADESGRLDICDSHIGQLFAHAPGNNNGQWPIGEVCRVAEEIGTDRLGSGLHVGICNSRGVVCRGKGGDQERELAAKYEGFANHIRYEMPFVAGVLDSVADAYKQEARRWDESERWEE